MAFRQIATLICKSIHKVLAPYRHIWRGWPSTAVELRIKMRYEREEEELSSHVHPAFPGNKRPATASHQLMKTKL